MNPEKPLTILCLFILTLFFCLPVMANETITSMDDLPPLRDDSGSRRMDGQGYANSRILIYYETPDTNNIGQLGLYKKDFSAGTTITDQLDLLEVSGSADAKALIDEIDQKPQVKAVDYEMQAKAFELPNDQYIDLQYNYSMIGMDKAWKRSNENEVKVAVLDTGLDTSSPDLVGRYKGGYDYLHKTATITDDNGHGSAVIHIMTAFTNNEIGIAGCSGTYNVVAVPYKVLDSEGYGRLSDISPALIAAASDPEIKVVNLSLGFDNENSVLETLIQGLYDKNKVVVAASGNDGGPVLYPARYPQVIAVGSVDENSRRCTSVQWGLNNGSNYGQGLDLVAPGNNIPTKEGDGYICGSGTSYSAPEVAAAAAILLTENGSLSNEEVKSVLGSTAKDLGTKGYDTEYGYGLLQVDKALELVRQGKTQEPEDPGSDTPETPQILPTRLSITAHCENVGWLPAVSNLTVAGTVGKNQKLEAFRISDDNPNLSIHSQVHVENIGTIDPVGENEMAGTTGHNFGIEAVQFELSGIDASQYKLYYRAHVENYGWTAWTSNGNWAGTTGLNLQLEAIQMTVVKATDPAPTIPSNVDWSYR